MTSAQAAAPARVSRRALGAVGALAVAAFCFGTTESLPVGLLPLISDDLDVSASAVGLLVTGYGGVVAVMSVPLTRMTARTPRRRLLTAVMAVFVLMTWAAVAAPGYWVLLGARVVTALAQAVFWPVATVAAAGLLPPHMRGRAGAFVFAGGSVAIVAGVPLGTWLGREAHWRATFAVLGVLTLLAMVVIAALLPDGAPGESHAAAATRPDARRFRILIVALTLAVGGCFTAFTYITEFLTDFSGFSGDAISPLLLVNGIADVAGLIVAGMIVDRGPGRLFAASVLLITVALLGGFTFGELGFVAVGMLALLGLAMPGVATSMQARVLETAPGNTDIASAWGSAAFNVGIAGGALLGGVLLPLTGVRGTALAGALVAGAGLVVMGGERLLPNGREPP